MLNDSCLLKILLFSRGGSMKDFILFFSFSVKEMFDNALHTEEVVRVNGNSTYSIIRWNLFVNKRSMKRTIVRGL